MSIVESVDFCIFKLGVVVGNGVVLVGGGGVVGVAIGLDEKNFLCAMSADVTERDRGVILRESILYSILLLTLNLLTYILHIIKFTKKQKKNKIHFVFWHGKIRSYRE